MISALREQYNGDEFLDDPKMTFMTPPRGAEKIWSLRDGQMTHQCIQLCTMHSAAHSCLMAELLIKHLSTPVTLVHLNQLLDIS